METCERNILLSICIPTYNRCEILEKTILSIINSSGFCDEVEIVISDNCSIDNTKYVVNKYQSKYRNIVYHRNEVNILDKNFIKVLSLGSGEYLKLLNDTAIINEGVVETFLSNIKKHRNEKPALFFYNNN